MKKLVKFFKSLNILEWLELIAIVALVIYSIITAFRIAEKFHKEDQQAYNMCVEHYGNEKFCAKQIYGIY